MFIIHIMEQEQATALLLAFMPDECPYGGNHGGACDSSCRDPYGLPGFDAPAESNVELAESRWLLSQHPEECQGCAYCNDDTLGWAGPMNTSLY